MTLKLLIVDDEPIVSQGLSATIPWQELGVEIAGVAYNGKQGLNMLEGEKIDIILSDISMPEMDGLEMAEHVFHDYPDTKIIMFSGYDDFEYARKAIRLGVEDYLLKPVDVDELCELILKVKQGLIDQRKDELRRQNEMIAKYLRHQIIEAPLTPELEQGVQDFRQPYRLVISEWIDYALLVQTRSGQEMHELKTAWQDRFRQALSMDGWVTVSVFARENQLITFCYQSECDPSESEGSRLDVEQIRLALESMAGDDSSFRIGVSSEHDQLSQVPGLYRATYAMIAHSRGKSEQVWVLDDAENKPTDGSDHAPSIQDLHEQYGNEMKSLVLNGKREQAGKLIDQMFANFQSGDMTLRQTLLICREWLSQLKNELKTLVPNRIKDSFPLQFMDQVDLDLYNSYESLRQRFITDIDFLFDALADNTNRNHWIIESVKKDIREHYREDLKASELAERHYISPNYLSVLFKQETGQSFSEFVNALRIEKACELLETTSRKVFVIAEEVGYKEYKYFVQVFKKHVGITPTRFRLIHSRS